MLPLNSVLPGAFHHGDDELPVKAIDVPDDVWIDIFESIDSPAALAALMRTCKRFNALASKPLLRELRWGKMESTRKNLEAWDPHSGVYKDVVGLTRKVTIGVSFGFASNVRSAATDLTTEYELHDWMYLQLPRFTSLNELSFDGTVISPYVYTVLAQIPTLRTLSLVSCSVFPLYTAFADRHAQRTAILPDLFQLPHGPTPHFQLPSLHAQTTPTEERFPFENLPITHLSFHRGANLTDHETGPYHPLHILAAHNLSSLAITWTQNVASVYSRRQWLLPKLETLEVVMPLFTRDLIDSLVGFVGHCPLGPRIQLAIERHNLSDQQIGTVTIPLRGVWSYKGPLGLAAFSLARDHGSSGDGAEEKGTLTHMVMNEPLDLPGLLDGIEKLPQCVQDLEIQVRKWDVEVLFAIRSLFPDIRRLVVKYGSGTFPVDFFVTLGSNILFDLKNLHTIKLIHDRACNVTSRNLSSGAAGAGGFFAAQHVAAHAHTYPHSHSFEHEHDIEYDVLCLGPSASKAARDDTLEQADLKDYLIGWNRYCRALRCVQLDKESWWERRFEGDRWIEVVPVKKVQEPVGDGGMGLFF